MIEDFGSRLENWRLTIVPAIRSKQETFVRQNFDVKEPVLRQALRSCSQAN